MSAILILVCLVAFCLLANGFKPTNIALKTLVLPSLLQRSAPRPSFFSTRQPITYEYSSLQATAGNSASAEKKNVAQSKGGRLTKLVVFSGLIARAFSISTLIDSRTLMQCALASVVACSCALRKIEDCYSFGYGGSLLFIGIISVPEFCEQLIVSSPIGGVAYDLKNVINSSSLGVRTMIWGGFFHALAYVLYGFRMLAFIRARNNSLSYQNSPINKVFSSKEKDIPLSRRVFVWLSTAVLLGCLYTLPLHLHLNKVSQSMVYSVQKEVLENKAAAGPIMAIVSLIGSFTALGAVTFQAIADFQKTSHKEKVYQQSIAPASPALSVPAAVPVETTAASESETPVPKALLPFATTGLFATWRHPNYLGEFIFHTGIFLASAPAFTSWGSVLLALIGPAVFASIIRGATTNLERRQLGDYGGKFNGAYEKWVKKTKRFF